MSIEFTPTARRLGLFSAGATAILLVAYAITLAIGLVSLKSPDDPIGNPWFTMLEVEIIVRMPAIVTLFVAVHAWAPAGAKTLSLSSLIFMAVLAGITCSLHLVFLTLSRQAEFADQPWLRLFMTFEWPSVAYALDILAWDIFFAVAMLCAAPVFSGSRVAERIRRLMIASGVLSLAIGSSDQLENGGCRPSTHRTANCCFPSVPFWRTSSLRPKCMGTGWT